MSALQTEALAFIKAHAGPETGGSWKGGCGKLMIEFGAALGWETAPAGDISTAEIVGSRSGALNGDAGAAPAGAYHFFTLGKAGHVGQDLLGGGTDVFMATDRKGGTSLATYIRIMPAWVYVATGGVTYRGWSTNYAGGVPKLPAEASRVLVGAMNVRSQPTTDSKIVRVIPGGAVVPLTGFVHGTPHSGSDVWFYHDGDGFYWSGNFTDPSTAGLTDYTAGDGFTVPADTTTEPAQAPVETTTPEPAPSGPDPVVTVPSEPTAPTSTGTTTTIPTAWPLPPVISTTTPTKPATAPPKSTVKPVSNPWLHGGVIAGLIAVAGAIIALCFGH